MDLSLERWDGATHSDRNANAVRLAKQLPTGFAFDSARRCRLGDQQHEVAFFRQGSSRFALIPGGPVRLGYDAGRPWQPTSDELESWEFDHDDWFEPDRTIQECIAEVTLRPHSVEFTPFLIETTAGELGWEPVGLDDPIIPEMLRGLGPFHEYTKAHEGGKTRVRRRDDGSIVAERFLDWTHADLAGQLAVAGFRFPTSDEWEYACGAGAPTLFRWGDHVPCDWPHEEGMARPGDSPGGFPYDWDLYSQPNAFGIVIATDSYKDELVAEIGTTRGGDGGNSACGGAAAFITWLRYATAYFEGSSCTHDPAKPITTGYTIGRRVLALP
jgi:hypothetical protein